MDIVKHSGTTISVTIPVDDPIMAAVEDVFTWPNEQFHAPNEHFHLSNVRRGAETIVRLWDYYKKAGGDTSA